MAILDAHWVFIEAATPVDSSDVADLTTGTSFSVNRKQIGPFDSGNATVDLFGLGKTCYLCWHSDTAPASGGASTINLRLVSSATSALGTPTVHYSTGVTAYNIGTFAAGLRHIEPIAPQTEWLGFVGMDFVIADADLTAASWTLTAFLTAEPDLVRAYQNGMNFGY